jgi:hypothetical protein
MPDQPELTIQGWVPAGPDADRPDPDLARTLPKAARKYLPRALG